MAEPRTHYFEVTASVESRGAVTEFVMPVWTPGSYMVREFSQHVESFRARDEAGRELPAAKTEKNRWRVESKGTKKVEASYRVYAFDVSVRTPFVDDSHAVVNGAGLFVFSPGSELEPIELRLDPPEGWTSISTALELAGDDPRIRRAPDYDALVDCPIEIGTHEVFRFEVANVPHEVAIFGRGNVDRERFVADVKRIVEASAALMGGLPYPRYVFIVHLLPTGTGGLEHRSSSLMQFSRFDFQPASEYQRQLSLVSHEFFHTWNVKRIRPEPLGRFDYGRENYTTLLWMAEGFTTYYQEVILRRAGLQSADDMLAALAKSVRIVLEHPGASVQSLEEASTDAWIKHYRPNENAKNSRVSYYVKGSVVAMLLDLELRARTAGKKSLDDVMRALDRQCSERPDATFSDADLRRALASAAGSPLDALLDRLVRTTEPPNVASAVRPFGLDIAQANVAGESPSGWLGIFASSEAGRTIVDTVLLAGPASRAGLSARDEIIAIDGFRVDDAGLRARIGEREPGDRVTLTIARDEMLRTIEVTLGEAPADVAFVRRASATAAEKALYENWIGEPFGEPSAVARAATGEGETRAF
ncbi:MAG: M61 family metallopeptidase [Planctomycetes bacterium]|nr:M61 family metallopeptidase [Planctomycetota bacterium]